jgi:hypothetical protein
MFYRWLADAVLSLHFAFVLFVVFGGLLAFRWPRVAYVHVPIALYGVIIELLGFVCPLTPLEIWLRRQGGEAGYEGGFIEHYITAALYPTQYVLAGLVFAINAVVYVLLWRKRRASQVRP